MTLALKYRPAVWADVSGQKHVTAVLYRMARRGTLPSALLLAGSMGCGKTSTARILGAALNCEAENQSADVWPCGSCPSCKAVAAGNSLDVIEVDAASNGGIDAIRQLQELARYGSPGRWKVVLLDEAHAMSRDGFNALLKMLEEPPENTLFVLLTTEPGKIMATVASRCMTFTFRRLPPAAIIARLEHICGLEDIRAEPALLAEIASRADGGMRDAVMLLDQVTSVGITDLARFTALLGESDVAVPLVQAMAAGDYPAVYAALDEAVAQAGDPGAVTAKLADLLADLLVLRSGGAVAAQGEPLEARKALAARLDTGRLTAAVKALWDLQTKVRVEDRRAGLKLACVVVSERLCPAPKADPHPGQPPVNGVMPCAGSNGHGETSLDELRQALGAT
jgi:DNA polymerase III subunit gamma/tau